MFEFQYVLTIEFILTLCTNTICLPGLEEMEVIICVPTHVLPYQILTLIQVERFLSLVRDQRTKKAGRQGKSCETREIPYTCRYTSG